MSLPRRASTFLLVLPFFALLVSPAVAVEDDVSLDLAAFVCESAEECFERAVSERIASLSPESRLTVKIRRLQVLRERFPGSLWAKRASLLLGMSLAERQPAEALLFLRAARRDLRMLEDYIRLWMGEALLRTGDVSRAALLFESIHVLVPDTLLRSRAAFRGGEAWYRAGRCDRASEWLSFALTVDSNDRDAPPALLSLADCQLREAQREAGVATLRQLWVQYPQTPEADEAIARLSESATGEAWQPTPEDRYDRATSFLSRSLHDRAVDELEEFLSAAPDHPLRDEARLKLGTAFVRLKRYDQAREVFERVAVGQRAEAGKAAVWLARIYLRQDDGKRLLALRRSLSQRALSSAQKADILFFTGIWLEDQGQFERATSAYQKVAQLGKVSRRHAEALWRIGWIQYRTGRYRDSVKTLRELADGTGNNSLTSQALYWMARAFDRERDPKASKTYRRLCREYPLTYYCQIARERVPLTLELPVPDDQTGAVPIDTRSKMARDIHYRRALELKLLGMDADASRELASLVKRYARDREGLVELSTLLNEVGAYHQAIRLARRHFRVSLEFGGKPAPPALWNVAYPTAYLPVIRAHAGPRVDPYLVAAIIREESHYDTQAISPVGALGLMQLMPATAHQVAQQLGISGVDRHELLSQETNILLGVRYLEQLLEEFDGKVLYAVAAYNAGPRAVSRWIQERGDTELDEFVELIPYRETRRYVKRVLRSYREYHRLERGGCDSRSLDKVC